MKIIETSYYTSLSKLKIFSKENYKDILSSFKSLPKKEYEIEMFETTDNKGIVLSFDDDLHIKIKNEDREKFEKYFGIKTSDHIIVDIMKIIETKKYADSKGPNMKTLKKNKKPLTEEERKKVINKGAVWHHGPNGEETPAIWKSVVNGKEWFICNTHRAYQCKSTLESAIKSYDFIETTASSKKNLI